MRRRSSFWFVEPRARTIPKLNSAQFEAEFQPKTPVSEKSGSERTPMDREHRRLPMRSSHPPPQVPSLDTSKPPKMASFAASVANAAVFRPAVVRR